MMTTLCSVIRTLLHGMDLRWKRMLKPSLNILMDEHSYEGQEIADEMQREVGEASRAHA